MQITRQNKPTATIYYEFWRTEKKALVSKTPIITLINGHTRSLTDFRLMGKALNEAGLDVIALDNRGAGKTVTEMPFTLDGMVDDIVALWAENEIQSSHVLGISMGGFIAQALTLKAQQKIESLTLVSTAPDKRYIMSSESGWMTNRDDIEKKMESYFAPDFVTKNRLLIDAMIRQTTKAIEEGDFIQRSEAQRDALRNCPPLHIEDIKVPTLLVHGGKDRTVEVAGSKEILSRISGSTLHMIADAGHLLLAEAPKELYRLVIDFCLKK